LEKMLDNTHRIYGRRSFARSFLARAVPAAVGIALLACCIPRTAAILNGEGLTLYRNGQYDRAYASFSEAIALSPDSAELYFNRAAADEKLARLRDADADYTKAIELDPEYREAYLGRGGLSLTRRRYEAAREDLTSAIEISPGDPTAYLERGRTLQRLDRPDEALADFDAAVKLSPKDPAPLIWRARFFFENGDFDRALADLDTAIPLDSKSPEPYLWRGVVYEYGLADTAAALDSYSRAVGADPKDPYVRNYRGNLLRKLGRTEEALSDFSAICRMGYPFGCWQYQWIIDGQR
jgi:tetratricopeptide (TPR) repeat protein